jgi:site-specific recombinase XerD
VAVVLQQVAAGRFVLAGAADDFRDDANRFLEALTVRGLAPTTRRAYGFDLVVLARWLGPRGLTLRQLRAADLLEFIAVQRTAGAQPTSINRRLTTCRLLYRFCTDRELDGGPGSLGPAPYYRGRGRDRALGLHRVPRPPRLKLRVKTARRVVEPLVVSEVRRFLGTLRRYRDLAIVHLMLLCGLRCAEVLQLRRTDVGFDTSEVRVRGKGNKERLLPLPAVVARSLGDYLQWERPTVATTPHLFVVLQGRQHGRPMTLAGLRSLFRQRRRDYRLARANPHRFRHTFGADMARSGVRLPILQRLMGHADGMTTLQYIHLSMADVAEEYARAVAAIAPRYRR